MHLLKTSHPNLKLSLHRPKLPDAVDLQRVRQSEALFDTRLPQIVAKGGIGNTLLFRGLPEETTCEEFQSILCQFVSQLHGASSPACRPLRMRFAPAREKGRNFWAVYASVDVCRAAFVSVNVCVASFRCGKCVTLHPVVHNDAKDVDEKKRRDRSVALDDQFSKAARPAYVNVERKVDSVELLHSFLRQTQDTFVFMSEADV